MGTFSSTGNPCFGRRDPRLSIEPSENIDVIDDEIQDILVRSSFLSSLTFSVWLTRIAYPGSGCAGTGLHRIKKRAEGALELFRFWPLCRSIASSPAAIEGASDKM
jgi:hypothetical protein